MGVEDFGLILKPTTGVEPAQLAARVVGLGFVETPPRLTMYGALEVGSPRSNQRAFERTDGPGTVECLLVQAEPSARELSYVSLRFAVCQPRETFDTFADAVSFLVRQHAMVIGDDYRLGGCGASDLGRYLASARERFAEVKADWHRMFGGAPDEPKLRVGEAWGYFLARYPDGFELPASLLARLQHSAGTGADPPSNTTQRRDDD